MATYLVTGSSRGLGLEIATQLAAMPLAQVGLIFATARSDYSSKLREVVQGSAGRVVFVKPDVEDKTSIEDASIEVEKVLDTRGLDVLINNVGIMPFARDGIETIGQRLNSERGSSETALLRLAVDNHDLTVYQLSFAQKIPLNGSEKAVGGGVELEGLVYTLNTRQEVIVPAGAFYSPELLPVSGIGPHDTSQRYKIPEISVRSGVGQNLWVS
ncbi:MAG: hypothetical protein Q9191_001153 [Dirinaria sp. TL-2023a]